MLPEGNSEPTAMGARLNWSFRPDENGATIGELMHDGQGILLDFNGDTSLKTWTTEYGGRMKYLCGLAKEQ
jgi:hypothetical protein